MNVQHSTYGSLHHKTQTKFPTLDAETPVFVARRGTRIVGTAYVQHNQFTTNTWSSVVEDREIQCTVSAADPTIEELLVNQARSATRHLKRRFRAIPAN